MTQIAVVVPGLMGSELRLGNDVIWPGPVSSLWLPYTKMAELTRDDLVATDVIRQVSFSRQYATLIDELTMCGFRETSRPPTLYVCPYDWRKKNELAAGVLAQLLDRVVEAHGSAAEIALVAHSMGGLVARYYLESGEFCDRPGFGCVKRLITIGTPHRGSPLALTAGLGMEKAAVPESRPGAATRQRRAFSFGLPVDAAARRAVCMGRVGGRPGPAGGHL